MFSPATTRITCGARVGRKSISPCPRLPDLAAERAGAHLTHEGKHAAAQPEPSPAPAPKVKKVNPLRLQQMKDRCREIEEQVARLEVEIEGYGQESAHFKSAEESVRLAKLIEQGTRGNHPTDARVGGNHQGGGGAGVARELGVRKQRGEYG